MKLNPKYRKTDEEGVEVTLFQDIAEAWYLGRPGDDEAYHPTPMGAFISEAAARKWADHHFSGGDWKPV